MNHNSLRQLCDTLLGSIASRELDAPTPTTTTHDASAAASAPATEAAAAALMSRPSPVASTKGHGGQARQDDDRLQPSASTAPHASTSSTPLLSQSRSSSNASSISDDASHREMSLCSQCKQKRTLDHFPVRLTSLQPYLVCKSHEWYWTQEKRLTYWAPEYTITLEDVCGQLAAAMDNLVERGARMEDTVVTGSWLVDGGEDDRGALVKRITSAGGWDVKPVHQRRSRAKGPNPPPKPWNYLLQQSKYPTAPQLRLVLTHHESFQKWVITLREDAPRQAGPWAEAKRIKKGAAAAASSTTEGGEDHGYNPEHELSLMDRLVGHSGAAGYTSEVVVKRGPGRPRKRKGDVENATPARSRSTKGQVRSEEDQRRYDMIKTLEAAIGREATAAAIGTSNYRNGSSRLPKRSKLQTSSMPRPNPSSATSSRPSRSALISAAGQLAPRAAFAPLLSGRQSPGMIGPSMPVTMSYPNVPSSVDFVPSNLPYESARPAAPLPPQPHHHPNHAPRNLSRHHPNRLTLDELLESPYTDPPMIPLTKRVFQAHPPARAQERPRPSTVQGRVRFVEDDVPSSDAIGPDEDDDDEDFEQPDEDDEDAFEEDSCEDDESGDEDEEFSDGGSGEEDDDDEDEEDEEDEEEGEEEEGGDWLTGFVKGQLMHSGQGAGQEEVDELEEEEMPNEAHQSVASANLIAG
ncbi:BQ2448_6512 [Microbotryum intermedium]|uniref:BQ2448_6512 protein n=1 Tax=Microbotryum intermedium TaxID=269621 RepID=A0A238FJW5_9BASI|nr:BQ2448_6512 [Microbotryum intermedium]